MSEREQPPSYLGPRTEASHARETQVPPPQTPHVGGASAEPETAAEAAPTAAPDRFAALPAPFGRYELRRRLGAGGMGAVFLAYDHELQREVALKVPRFEDGRPELVERFYREARAAAQLRHPGVCPVHDVGQIGGVHFLTMSYIDGSTLAEVLQQHGPLPTEQAARCVRDVARAVQSAHDRGLIHRDLKPGNVMIDRTGQAVVMDFGLAQRLGDTGDDRLTRQGMLVGTPAYMAPEQIASGSSAAGSASDQYSLAVVLYELLTGERPFRAPSVGKLLARIETEEPVPPCQLRPTLDARLEAICLRAMAKDPARRFASLTAFADALDAWLAAPNSDSTHVLSAPTVEFSAPPPRRRRWPLVVGLCAAAALLLGTVLFIQTNHGTVEVRLSDPKANVEVKVDGDVVTLTDAGRTTTLRVGTHKLTVSGAGFETETRSFALTRGARKIVEVTLRPRGESAKVPAKPKMPQADPPNRDDTQKPGQGKEPTAQEVRARVDALLKRAEELAHSQRGPGAVDALTEAIKLDPSRAELYAQRASVLERLNRLTEAQADCDQALKRDPKSAQAQLVRAAIHGKRGDYDACIAAATAALEHDRDLALAYLHRGLAHLYKHDYAEVVADMTAVLKCPIKKIEDRFDALYYRGIAQASLGKFSDALADLDQAIALKGRYQGSAYLARSEVHAHLRDAERAKDDRTRALAIDPNLADREHPIIVALAKLPRPVAAPSAEDREQAVALVRRMQLEYIRRRRPDEMIRLADEAIKLDPDSADALAGRATGYLLKGQFEAARRDCDAAIRLDVRCARAYLTRGIAHIELNEPYDSIADATVAARLMPKDPAPLSNRAFACLAMDEYHQCVADCRASLKIDPNFVPALGNLAGGLTCLGQLDEALRHANRVTALDPRHVQAYRLRAAIYRKRGDAPRLQKEMAALRQLKSPLVDVALPIILDPSAPQRPQLTRDVQAVVDTALVRAGRAFDEGNDTELRRTAEEVLRHDPSNVRALEYLAVVHAKLRQSGEALRRANEAIKLDPEAGLAHFARGLAYSEKHQYARAIAEYTITLRLRPEFTGAWNNRGRCYNKRGDYDQGIADTTMALRFDKNNVMAYANRFDARVRLGQYKEALEDANETLRCGSLKARPRYLWFRAGLYARMKRPEEAARDLAEARRLDPTIPARLPDFPAPHRSAQAQRATAPSDGP